MPKLVVGATYESKDTGNRFKLLKKLDGGERVRVRQLADRTGHQGVFYGEEMVWHHSSLDNPHVTRVRAGSRKTKPASPVKRKTTTRKAPAKRKIPAKRPVRGTTARRR